MITKPYYLSSPLLFSGSGWRHRLRSADRLLDAKRELNQAPGTNGVCLKCIYAKGRQGETGKERPESGPTVKGNNSIPSPVSTQPHRISRFFRGYRSRASLASISAFRSRIFSFCSSVNGTFFAVSRNIISPPTIEPMATNRINHAYQGISSLPRAAGCGAHTFSSRRPAVRFQYRSFRPRPLAPTAPHFVYNARRLRLAKRPRPCPPARRP